MGVQEQVLRTVGRYEIVREVGRGGTAVVYLARQTDLDRHVALKELAAFHAADPDFVERFLRESRLAGSLSHPNIVTVHEYFEHDGTAFIAMEYFERGSLRPLVGRLRLEQVGGVLEGLLAGLAHAERRGVVHRDLKPENVMVTSEGSVKIADFGIAKALQGPAARSLTGTGSAVGTPAYMAPELATGGEVGPWTDLYGLGVTAYELLAGRLPFPEAEPALALMLRHANETPPPLRSIVRELDPDLAGWVDRLLAKAPRDRPRGAGVAAEELDEILIAALGPRWRRQARLVAAEYGVDGDGRTPVADAGSTPVLPAAERRGRRRVPLIAAAGALVLAAGVAGVVLATGSGEGAPPTTPPAPVADVIPPPSERVQLATGGPAVAVVDPQGRIVRLEGGTLLVRESLTDPARPRSAVLARGALFLADDQALTALDPVSLAPRAARSLRGSPRLATAGDVVGLALAEGAAAGRVCVVAAGLRLDPCAELRFAPAGLGVASSGRLYVADAQAGSVTSFRSVAGALAASGAPIAVGRRPHGRLVLHEGLLYVPIERGIAVVDLAARTVVRAVRLPVTPSDIWIAPATGRLFAALPGVDRVAVLDTGSLDAAPALVWAGTRPVAVAGGADRTATVLVFGSATVTTLAARTGAALATRRVPQLAAPPPQRLVLERVEGRRASDLITITLALSGGRLDDSSLVVRDGTIADGRASFELWQGGIATRVRARSAAGIDLRVTPAAGRLVVSLAAPGGDYERLRIGRQGQRTIVVTLRRSPAPAPPTGGTTSTGGTTPPPTQTPTETPPSPKDPPYDIG